MYGISDEDLEQQQYKIDRQKSYLENNSFVTQNGEYKTFLDVSMSANISSRYYAQLVNKVNTLQQLMSNEQLIPVFLTITLDGAFQRLLAGDYSKFIFDEDNKKCHLKLLPENDRFGYLKSKALRKEKFTVVELYKLLRCQWYKFQNSYNYLKMKKEGYKIGYLFNVEPHESGVPHAHVLLYIPEHYKYKILEEFKKAFPAPQNLSKSPKKLTKEQIKNGEILGFQWTIDNPVAYVMKYCTKTFMDLKNQDELNHLQAWYMKHRILRITMSHTLVPQWVYKKVYPIENDWLYLSEISKKYDCEWSEKEDFFIFTDNYKKQVIKYERGLYQLFINDKLIKEFGEKKEIIEDFEYKVTKKYKFTTKTKLKAERNKLEKPKIVRKGYKTFYHYEIDDILEEVPTVPAYMKDFELLQYFHTLNPEDENLNLHHYAITKNECVKRGLISGEIESINSFDLDYIGA